MKNLTDQNFEETILNADKPVIVDFGQNGVLLVKTRTST